MELEVSMNTLNINTFKDKHIFVCMEALLYSYGYIFKRQVPDPTLVASIHVDLTEKVLTYYPTDDMIPDDADCYNPLCDLLDIVDVLNRNEAQTLIVDGADVTLYANGDVKLNAVMIPSISWNELEERWELINEAALSDDDLYVTSDPKHKRSNFEFLRRYLLSKGFTDTDAACDADLGYIICSSDLSSSQLTWEGEPIFTKSMDFQLGEILDYIDKAASISSFKLQMHPDDDKQVWVSRAASVHIAYSSIRRDQMKKIIAARTEFLTN